MDNARAEALYERIFTEMTCGLGLLAAYLGYRLGLFKELAQSGPVTSTELAQRTSLSERYVREWLLAVATSEYVDVDKDGVKFTLPEEHAAVLADEGSPFFAGAFPGVLQGSAIVIDPLIEAFKSGGGVPYEDYGKHLREGVALSNRPMYEHEYAQKWIPAMPDVETKLRNGGRVADIGSGVGWSSIFVAEHFESIRVDGIDADIASVEEARQLAKARGLSERVKFHATTIEDFEIDEPYDLVTAFDCLHDMPYPVQMLSQMRKLASSNGVVFIADEAGGNSFSENQNLTGRFLYNVSVLHCLPQAMVYPNAAGTGTAISESTVRKYAEEAGYSDVAVLNIENPFFRFYRLTP